MRYRNYHIEYDPPPIPVRSLDYAWRHDDCDGPEDNRCGRAASVEDACLQIDEREDG